LALWEATFGLVEATFGLVEATFGLVEATFGLVEATLGLVEATLGLVEATLGLVEATLGLVKATFGVVKALTASSSPPVSSETAAAHATSTHTLSGQSSPNVFFRLRTRASSNSGSETRRSSVKRRVSIPFLLSRTVSTRTKTR
jgi:hypothetical protein